MRLNFPSLPKRYLPSTSLLLHKRRKEFLIVSSVIILAAASATYKLATGDNGKQTPQRQQGQAIISSQATKFLNQIGQSLIDSHDSSHGGWRFRSRIQAPHYQTDRDVGAASAGMGFLALAQAEPHDKRWLYGAKQTAAWLMAVSFQDGKGGRYWPDYVDDQKVSNDVYTSFDDGSIGIGDFFWQLYEKTHDFKYKQVAVETVQWTLSQAEPYSSNGLKGYRWKWDVTSPDSPYYMGMGEGAAGITYALATYAQRLRYSDPALAARCKLYMKGSLIYIDIVRLGLAKTIGTGRVIPETGVMGQTGDTELDSGYLSGVAGDSFMYLSLYQLSGDKQYLNQASSLLGWLSDSRYGPLVRVKADSFAWSLALDPLGGNDNHYATGVEEGSAGIGWTFLQAYKLTGNQNYLQTAEAAGNWLIEVAIKSPDGSLAWHEDEHPVNRLVHANLNNGAAGTGQFLQDLYLTTAVQKYKSAAQGTIKWLIDNARFKGRDIYWNDNSGNSFYSDDASWHWGLAGIAEFVQKMNGGPQDIVGEQPGLVAKY